MKQALNRGVCRKWIFLERIPDGQVQHSRPEEAGFWSATVGVGRVAERVGQVHADHEELHVYPEAGPGTHGQLTHETTAELTAGAGRVFVHEPDVTRIHEER